MKKTLKRTLALLLALSMMLSITSAFAVITPGTETGIVKEDDFEGTQVVTWGDIETLDDGNKVVKANTAQNSYKSVAVDSTKDVVVSFDAMAAQTTDRYKVFVRRTAADKTAHREYCDIAGLEFSGDGTIRRNGEGQSGLSAGSQLSTEIADYDANKWYSIDIVFEGVDSATFETTVRYYINGQLVGTLDGSSFAGLTNGAGLYYQSDAPISAVFVGSDDEVTDGKMYFDNVKIYELDADAKYYAYADVSSGKIDVEFSETPEGSMTGAVLKANDGTAVATTVTQQGRKLTATYDSAALESGEEYTLVLPANKSVTGKALANNVVVFTSPSNDSRKILYIAEHDFDDWTDASGSAIGSTVTFDDYTYTDSNSNAIAYGTLGTDSEGGKTYKISLDNSTSANYYIRFENGSSYAYEYSKVAGLNEFITELDIKSPESGQVTPEFRLEDTSENSLGRFAINKNGYFIASKKLSGNAAQLEWDIIDNTKSELNTDDYRAILTTAGQWYNIKIGVIPATGDVRYYLEDELIAEYTNPAVTDAVTVQMLNVRGNNWRNVTSTTEIDNVKFGWALGDAAIEKGAITFDATNTVTTGDPGWMTMNTYNYLIEKDNAASSEFASSAAIISADVTIDDVQNNLMVSVTNANGTALAAMQILNENGDVYIPDKAPNANGTAGSDGKYTFTNTETTASGVFKNGVATNVTAYVDAERTNVYLFINGLYVKTLTVANLQGYAHESKPFDFDADGTIERFETMPARVGVRMLQGADNNGNISISNAKIYKSSGSVTKLESIRLNSDGDEFSIHSADIPNALSSIEINYNADITATPTVALTYGEGNSVSLGDVTVSGGTATVPVTASIIPNGTYTLTVNGTAYTFVVDGDMGLVIEEFKVVNADGTEITTLAAGDYYAAVSAQNASDNAEKITLIIATYEGGYLVDLDYYEAEVGQGGELVVNQSTEEKVTLTANSNTTEVRAFLWNDFENAVPYRDSIVISK